MNQNQTNTAQGTVWFISRHAGAIEWARRQNLVVDRWVSHLDPVTVNVGDTVIGTLPVHLASAVCARGARYLHLTTLLPLEWRGRDLSASEMETAAATLKQFHIEEK